MGAKPIVRIEHNDSDMKFREKVNANFAALSRGSKVIGVPDDVDDAITEAVEVDVTDLVDMAIAAALESDIAMAISAAIGDAIEGTIATNIATAISDTVGGIRFTTEGGVARLMTNKTGSASVKGTGVSCSPSYDNAFGLQSNEFDTIGVVYEDDVADGDDCLVVFSGRAQVLVVDSHAMAHGEILLASATDGRFTSAANPGSGLPAVETHFKECGHVLESLNAGTDVLCYAMIHFN